MHNLASLWAAALAAAALRGPFALADAAPAPNRKHWSDSSTTESYTARLHHNSTRASSVPASSTASTSSTSGFNLFPPGAQPPAESTTGLLGQNPLSVLGSVLGTGSQSSTTAYYSPSTRQSSFAPTTSTSSSSSTPSTITTPSSSPSETAYHRSGHASSSPASSSSSSETPSGLLGGLTSALSSLLHGGSSTKPSATETTRRHRHSNTAPTLVGMSTVVESTSSQSGLNLGSLLPTLTGSNGLPLPSALSVLPASVVSDLSSMVSSLTDGIAPSHHHQPTGHGKHSDTSTSGLGLGITSILPSILSDVTATPTASGKSPTTPAPLPLSELSSILNSVTKAAGSATVPLASALSSVISQATATNGTVLPITLPSEVSSMLSQLTGTNGITALPSKLTHIVPSLVSSAVSEVSSMMSSVESQVTSALPTKIPSVLSSMVSDITSALPTNMPSVLSSVESKVSGVLTSAPIPTNPASIVSDLSSILSEATSSLISEATSNLPTWTDLTSVPPITGVVSSIPAIVTGIIPPFTGFTSDLPTTIPSLTLPASTFLSVGTGTGVLPTSVPSFTLSTTTDGTGTTAIPVPISTAQTASSGATSATPATSAQTTSQKTTPAPEVPATRSSSSTHTVSSSSFSSLSLSFDTSGVTTHPTSTGTRDERPTTSVVPIGTNTDKSLSLPTSWSFDPTGTNTGGISTATSSTGTTSISGIIPTSMPQLIQPPGGIKGAPLNTTKVQLAFNYGLNYPFVASTAHSATQIFAYLPQGIAYGLDIPQDRVLMYSLQPYNTADHLDYVTTLALVYVPTELVSTLQLDLHTPLSRLYNHPDPTVRRLMSMLNSAISVQPGNNINSPSSQPWNPVSPSAVNIDDAAPFGGDSGNTKDVVYSAVFIGVGAAVGAALYAASMVYIARRYSRRRRGHHNRASSVPAAGTDRRDMSQIGAPRPSALFTPSGMGTFTADGRISRGSAWSGRASRHSATSTQSRSMREQGISAPLMSENSLGWN